MDTLFVLVVAFAALAQLVAGSVRIPIDPPALAVFGFFATAVIGLVHGVGLGHEIRFIGYEFLNVNRFWIVFLLARRLIADEVSIGRLARGLYVVGVGLGIYGTGKYWLGLGVDLYGVGQRLPLYDSGAHVVFVLCFLGLLEATATRRIGPGRAALLLVPLLPALWTFLVSFRRGLWLAFALAVVVLVLGLGAGRLMRLVKYVALPAAAITLVVALLTNRVPAVRASISLLERRVASIGSLQDPNNEFRYYDSLNAIESIKENPVLGLGLGSFYAVRQGNPLWHAYAVARLNSVSHDTYLYVAMKLGLVAFVFFLMALAWIAVRAVRVIRLPAATRPRWALTAAAFYVAYLAFLASAPGLLFLPHALLFGVAMAYVDRVGGVRARGWAEPPEAAEAPR